MLFTKVVSRTETEGKLKQKSSLIYQSHSSQRCFISLNFNLSIFEHFFLPLACESNESFHWSDENFRTIFSGLLQQNEADALNSNWVHHFHFVLYTKNWDLGSVWPLTATCLAEFVNALEKSCFCSSCPKKMLNQFRKSLHCFHRIENL